MRNKLFIIIIYLQFHNFHSFIGTIICLLYNPVHLVESVENYALCMRRCLLCSSNMSVTHSALALRARIVLTPAPSIKLCAIARYRLFHSHAQVVSFTDSMIWTGVKTTEWRTVVTKWSLELLLNCNMSRLLTPVILTTAIVPLLTRFKRPLGGCQTTMWMDHWSVFGWNSIFCASLIIQSTFLMQMIFPFIFLYFAFS